MPARAHEALQELAKRKLPEVEEQIERIDAVRSWLNAARARDCDTPDDSGLFAAGRPPS